MMIRNLTRLIAVAVVLVSALAGTASAETYYSATQITNGTPHWIYVDTVHVGHITHHGFILDNTTKKIIVDSDLPYQLYVHIYVKAGHYEESKTLCHLTYEQGVTAKRSDRGEIPFTHYTVHYTDTQCFLRKM